MDGGISCAIGEDVKVLAVSRLPGEDRLEITAEGGTRVMKRNVLLSVALLFLVGAVSSAQCVCEPVVAEKYYTIGDRVRIGDAIMKIHSIRYAKPMFANLWSSQSTSASRILARTSLR